MEEVLNNKNETQIHLQTTINGLTNTMKSLNLTIERRCETSDHVCRDLLEAAKSGDVNAVKILFKDSNDSCTDYDVYRYTPLTCAAWYGHVEVVRVLLEGAADVDRADVEQDTALHVAAYFGDLDMCRLLLIWGAKVDLLDKCNDTPLHLAAERGELSVVKLLVERGADVSVKNKDGKTACDVARYWENIDVADWLDSVRCG